MRSAVLFVMGALGVAAETVVSLAYRETPDPELVIGFLAMMGLPAFLSQDAKGNDDSDRRRQDGAPDDDSPESTSPDQDQAPRA